MNDLPESVLEYQKATRIADEVLSEQYATMVTAKTVPREYADAAIADLTEKWQQAEARARELEVCGSCEYHLYGLYGCELWSGEKAPAESCHFTPSRWKRRA